MNGLFNNIAESFGMGNTGYFTEAELSEEMNYLESLPAANLVSEDAIDACTEAMLANERNYTRLVMSIANEEFEYLKRNGTELVYEGARLDAFFDKIKSMLDKAWQKIKEIFEKALAHINSWISTDKRFVDKYGDKIRDAGSVEIAQSYNIVVSTLQRTSVYSNIADAVKKSAEKDSYGAKTNDEKITSTDAINNFYKTLNSPDLNNTASTREEALKSYKGSTGLNELKKKVTLTSSEILEELANGKVNKTNIKTAYNDAKKAVAETKKMIDKKKSEAAKDNANTGNGTYGLLSTLCSHATSLMHGIQSIQLQAAKVYHSNCRKAAARVVAGKRLTVTPESADLDLEGAYDFFE